jgi:hypothetical protein
MDLIAIVVTVCALAHPDHCEEQRLEYMWNGSLTQCVMTAQPYISKTSVVYVQDVPSRTQLGAVGSVDSKASMEADDRGSPARG